MRSDCAQGSPRAGSNKSLACAADFVAETDRQRISASASTAGKEAALGKVERQIKRLVDAIADGADALPLNAKLKELDTERNRLASELQAASEEKPLIHSAMAIAYRQRVAALAQALYVLRRHDAADRHVEDRQGAQVLHLLDLRPAGQDRLQGPLHQDGQAR